VQLDRQIGQIVPGADIDPRLWHSHNQLRAAEAQVIIQHQQVIAVAAQLFHQIESTDADIDLALGHFFDDIGRAVQQHLGLGQGANAGGIAARVRARYLEAAALKKQNRAVVEATLGGNSET
jgi:hypothetical protein